MHRRHALAALSLAPLSAARADDALKAAIAGTHRTAANTARDVWRHPYETLSFFGIRADMTAVEMVPGGFWYTEILAPYLRERGRLVVAGGDLESPSPGSRRAAERLRQRLQAQPALYDRVLQGALEPPRRVALAEPGSADLVLTFRNVHNWAAEGDDMVLAVFAGVHETLKRGGAFGVVDHRLPEGRTQDAKVSSGYLHVSYVKRLAERAGFVLDAMSEVNANPRDTADHDGGVWALPPTYANKDKDRARYAAIGESDRMTLRFVKR